MNEPTHTQSTTGATVVGLFRNQVDAELAIQRLKQQGFAENQIGVAIKDRSRQSLLMEETGADAAEGAAAGAISGGVLGGVIGLIAGAGALALPGVGAVLAGGTLASILTGAGIGAAGGGLLGALLAMGISEEDALRFDRGIRAGGTLVAVNAGTRVTDASSCLSQHGADLGSLGRAHADSSEPWRGNERRYHDDVSYHGPERRLSRV